jgi:hypothetical protein
MEKKKLNISCDTVTLAVFMDCLFDSNYSALCTGVTDNELKEIWREIYEEYAKQSGNMKQLYILGLMRSIAIKEAKIMAFELSIGMSNTEAAELLKKFHYTGGKLRIEARVERDKIMLEAHKKELQKYLNREALQPKSTRADFIQWITVVSKFMSYRIDPQVVTVTEFINMDKMMKEAIKASNNKIGK